MFILVVHFGANEMDLMREQIAEAAEAGKSGVSGTRERGTAGLAPR
jgi:hypothetical protein